MGALFCNLKVAGLIPGAGTYRRQPIDVSLCLSKGNERMSSAEDQKRFLESWVCTGRSVPVFGDLTRPLGTARVSTGRHSAPSTQSWAFTSVLSPSVGQDTCRIGGSSSSSCLNSRKGWNSEVRGESEQEMSPGPAWCTSVGCRPGPPPWLGACKRQPIYLFLFLAPFPSKNK